METALAARRALAAVLLAALPPAGVADERARQDQQAVQRALIQLDQRAAEFAHRAAPGLQDLNAAQLRDAGRLPLDPDPVIARQLLPYERSRMAQEREQHVLRLPPPAILSPERVEPLPLPGGPRHGVDPIPAPRVGG